jgi:hypothetical protein
MTALLRIAFWLILWLVTLGVLAIDVQYADGLHITLKSWPDELLRVWRARRKPSAPESDR